MTVVYLSGPMRGYRSFNFPLFDVAAKLLRKAGIDVRNPTEHDREIYPDIEQWEGFATGDTTKCPKFILPESLRWDFGAILEADGIILLPGWRESSGAKAELFVAEATGKMVWEFELLSGERFTIRPIGAVQMGYPEVRA